MKRLYAALLCICVLVPAVVIGANSDFKAWKWKRSIDVHGAPGFVRIPIPQEIFNDSQFCLEDLRIIDDANQLVPHLLQWGYSIKGPQTEWRPAKLLNRSRIDKKYSRVVADFGQTMEKNAVRVSVSGTNFRRRVEVEGSNDCISWEKLPGTFLLFDVTMEGRQRKVDVLRLPRNNYRFLRLTVYNMPDEPESIAIEVVDGASRKTTVVKDLIPVPTKDVSISVIKDSKETLIRIDLGFKNLPINRIRIKTDDPYFHRVFSISGGNSPSKDRKDQTETFQTKAIQGADPIRYLCSGVFYRIRDKEGSHEILTVEDLSAPYRYLELRIHNGDNPPLNIVGVDLWRGSADLVFEARAGRSYALLGGNQTVSAPNYDLSRSIRDIDKSCLRVVELEPGGKTPEEIAPWTERHGTLILVALIVLSSGVGFLVFKSMKNLPKDR
jgi:hypothetical protein